jgi:hypothetical protein
LVELAAPVTVHTEFEAVAVGLLTEAPPLADPEAFLDTPIHVAGSGS